LTLVSLLAVLAAARGNAQTVELGSPPPLVNQSPQVPPSQDLNPAGGKMLAAPSPQVPLSPDSSPAAGEAVVTGEPISLDAAAKAVPLASLTDFLGYRYATGALEWIPGGGNQFGMFSIESDHYQKAGIANGFGVGMGFHFLSGPDQTDMPARVYDFSLAYQIREQLGPLRFDVATSVLLATDFKGSVREGILFPSHAVGFLSFRPEIDVVLGVDYLARADIKLLPVAGLILTPTPDVRYELVFPRPRAVFQLTDRSRLYLSGELGGGTWAIERVALGDDLASYRDLRACIGLEYAEDGSQRSAFEIGYLFDRRLEYSSGSGDMHLNDAVMFRLLTTY
jgi:hypothetical protein